MSVITVTTSQTSADKRGFTLVELSVVLALLSIITIMTVSFSIMLSKFTAENTRNYDFLQDCAVVEREIIDWATSNANTGTEFSIQDNKLQLTNTVEAGWVTLSASFDGGIFSLGGEDVTGGEMVTGVGTIERVSFATNGKLIKCTLFSHEDDISSSFVFFPMLGEINSGVAE